MQLKTLANSIKNNKNILEKLEINPIVQYIDKKSFKSIKVFSDIGQDSAAISNNDKFLLLTTDRIKPEFIENFPYGAGFSSILVSIDDVYACGGFPLAASIIISTKSMDHCKKLIKGICDASQKFNVPIIRGHTNINANSFELSSTIIGDIDKNNYISAINAQVGDKIILAVDFNGKVGRANKLYWDTVTFKESKIVLNVRKSMNLIAEKHLANSAKDISNGGIFGTLLQLIRYSGVGANINIDNLEIPPKLLEANYDLEIYSKMYLTSSFILSSKMNKCKEIIEIFKKHQLNATIVGEIIGDTVLKISDSQKSLDVIKF